MTLASSVNEQWSLPPQDFPPDDDVQMITSFREATEILRSNKFRTGYGEHSVLVDADAATSTVHIVGIGCPMHAGMVPWEKVLRRGALLTMQGREHMERRRDLNPLFVGDAHVWFRDSVILPAVQRSLKALLSHADTDGACSVDLVPFARRVFVQLSAALIGFDGVDTDEGADVIIAAEGAIDHSRRMVNILPPGPELEAVMTEALKAHRTLLEHLARPSFERRLELVRTQSGNDLSRDFLTLAAGGEIKCTYPDEPLFVGIQLLSNATGTNSRMFMHAVAEIAAYLERNPQKNHLRGDPEFLDAAFAETARLHPPGTGLLVRVAEEDVTLASGRHIPRGTRMAIVHAAIDRDPEVFGEDAEQFKPGRSLPPGTRSFGLAFGNGPHMCLGVPLVVGRGPLAGVQVPFIRALFEAGLELDHQRSPRWVEGHSDPLRTPDYASLPVVFRKAAAS
jgi:cytochrome P450